MFCFQFSELRFFTDSKIFSSSLQQAALKQLDLEPITGRRVIISEVNPFVTYHTLVVSFRAVSRWLATNKSRL